MSLQQEGDVKTAESGRGDVEGKESSTFDSPDDCCLPVPPRAKNAGMQDFNNNNAVIVDATTSETNSKNSITLKKSLSTSSTNSAGYKSRRRCQNLDVPCEEEFESAIDFDFDGDFEDREKEDMTAEHIRRLSDYTLRKTKDNSVESKEESPSRPQSCRGSVISPASALASRLANLGGLNSEIDALLQDSQMLTEHTLADPELQAEPVQRHLSIQQEIKTIRDIQHASTQKYVEKILELERFLNTEQERRKTAEHALSKAQENFDNTLQELERELSDLRLNAAMLHRSLVQRQKHIEAITTKFKSVQVQKDELQTKCQAAEKEIKHLRHVIAVKNSLQQHLSVDTSPMTSESSKSSSKGSRSSKHDSEGGERRRNGLRWLPHLRRSGTKSGSQSPTSPASSQDRFKSLNFLGRRPSTPASSMSSMSNEIKSLGHMSRKATTPMPSTTSLMAEDQPEAKSLGLLGRKSTTPARTSVGTSAGEKFKSLSFLGRKSTTPLPSTSSTIHENTPKSLGLMGPKATMPARTWCLPEEVLEEEEEPKSLGLLGRRPSSPAKMLTSARTSKHKASKFPFL